MNPVRVIALTCDGSLGHLLLPLGSGDPDSRAGLCAGLRVDPLVLGFMARSAPAVDFQT